MTEKGKVHFAVAALIKLALLASIFSTLSVTRSVSSHQSADRPSVQILSKGKNALKSPSTSFRALEKTRDDSEDDDFQYDDDDFQDDDEDPDDDDEDDGKFDARVSARIIQTQSLLGPDVRNFHMAMMGDSLVRYQYLSLVYMLRWGSWFDPRRMHPHLVKERSFVSPFHDQDWTEFYWQTNRMVAPYESCDCFRKHYRQSTFLEHVHEVSENRYYYDRDRNVSVTYIQAFGHATSQHGHRKASTALRNTSTLPLQLELPYLWEFDEWDDTVRYHIAKLKPRPTVVLVHAGLWVHNFTASRRERLAQSLEDAGIQGIWRTSTSAWTGRLPPSTATDAFMCRVLPCLNLSWTTKIDPDLWWDPYHFYEPVYRQMNEQMLTMIHSLS